MDKEYMAKAVDLLAGINTPIDIHIASNPGAKVEFKVDSNVNAVKQLPIIIGALLQNVHESAAELGINPEELLLIIIQFLRNEIRGTDEIKHPTA